MKPHPTLARTFGAALLGALTLAAGCDSESDTQQVSTPSLDPGQTPTQNPLAGNQSARDPHAGVPGFGAPPSAGATATPDGKGIIVHGVAITPPESWQKQGTTSSMRAAQYRLPPAEGAPPIDATLVVFQGIGGSAEDNIQRWIGQVVDKTEAPTRETIQTEDGLTIATIEMKGTYSVGSMMGGSGNPEPDSIFLGAVITGAEEAFPVFLRLVGPRATIEPRLEEWNALIESVERAP